MKTTHASLLLLAVSILSFATIRMLDSYVSNKPDKEESLFSSLRWLTNEIFFPKQLTPAQRANDIIQYNKAWIATRNQSLQGKDATAEELGEAMHKKLEPILKKAGLTIVSYGNYPDFNAGEKTFKAPTFHAAPKKNPSTPTKKPQSILEHKTI